MDIDPGGQFSRDRRFLLGCLAVVAALVLAVAVFIAIAVIRAPENRAGLMADATETTCRNLIRDNLQVDEIHGLDRWLIARQTIGEAMDDARSRMDDASDRWHRALARWLKAAKPSGFVRLPEQVRDLQSRLDDAAVACDRLVPSAHVTAFVAQWRINNEVEYP